MYIHRTSGPVSRLVYGANHLMARTLRKIELALSFWHLSATGLDKKLAYTEEKAASYALNTVVTTKQNNGT